MIVFLFIQLFIFLCLSTWVFVTRSDFKLQVLSLFNQRTWWSLLKMGRKKNNKKFVSPSEFKFLLTLSASLRRRLLMMSYFTSIWGGCVKSFTNRSSFFLRADFSFSISMIYSFVCLNFPVHLFLRLCLLNFSNTDLTHRLRR